MPRSGRINPLFLDSEPEVITSRRREPLRGVRADATIRVIGHIPDPP